MKKRNLTLSMVVCILIVTLLAPISGAAPAYLLPAS